ncbi:hypothetical protein [Aliarcobacter butzleri]|uniref:hypothetical protein n=1 Tax=Aliarcobacter butzleri TaxID=28197 RepID=UPI002B24E43F|nr:hypothetical protein [Aliarcobacter butzleri]
MINIRVDLSSATKTEIKELNKLVPFSRDKFHFDKNNIQVSFITKRDIEIQKANTLSSKRKYLENLKKIKCISEENHAILTLIEKEELEKCPFCVGDIIKNEYTTIEITNIRFNIENEKETFFIASGFSKKGFDMICINNKTIKIDKFE